MLRPDSWIVHQALEYGMIEPFVDKKVSVNAQGVGVISYGLSSFGYDIRLGQTFKVFVKTEGGKVDPKQHDARTMVDVTTDAPFEIPPHSSILARSAEYIRMPSTALALVLGKSTYARAGIFLNTTPLEPGWRGYITLEIYNATDLPAVLYPDEGIGQILFFDSETMPIRDYGTGGKYQNQDDAQPVPARV